MLKDIIYCLAYLNKGASLKEAIEFNKDRVAADIASSKLDVQFDRLEHLKETGSSQSFEAQVGLTITETTMAEEQEVIIKNLSNLEKLRY